MRRRYADLDALEHPGETGTGVLSMYLLTDSSTAGGRNLHAQVNDLSHELHAALADAPATVCQAMEEQVERVRALFDRPGEFPRAVAVFASPAWDTVREVRLAGRVAPEARWGPRPYLAPLLAALDESERALVLLIDNSHARVYDVFADAIERVAHFDSAVPAHHRAHGGARAHTGPDWSQGGWARAGIEHRHADRVEKHAERAVALLADLTREQAVDRILLAGPSEIVAEVRHLLPKRLRGKTVATLDLPMYATDAEVLDAAKRAQAELSRAADTALVAELLDAAGMGVAVLGIDAVFEAVADRRISSLVVAGGSQVAGGQCPSCGRLVAAAVGPDCPVCRLPVEPCDHLIDQLIDRAIVSGARVAEVGPEAALPLVPHGGLGAFLRYR